ncbi:S8 family serine peptidase [Streptomyces sp. NPDC086023]|uniref:S8 family serine peptidase n=1 Tax=Streptomyces sp. NPDC086023 TaxID=3365746 RepID=UPI0037CD7703
MRDPVRAAYRHQVGVPAAGARLRFRDALGAKVIPVRTSLGTALAFAAGHEGTKRIRYAADHGAKIINLSWGDYYAFKKLKSAVQYAQSKGGSIHGLWDQARIP